MNSEQGRQFVQALYTAGFSDDEVREVLAAQHHGLGGMRAVMANIAEHHANMGDLLHHPRDDWSSQ